MIERTCNAMYFGKDTTRTPYYEVFCPYCNKIVHISCPLPAYCECGTCITRPGREFHLFIATNE